MTQCHVGLLIVTALFTKLNCLCTAVNGYSARYGCFRSDVNATDNFKWTALHFACHCGIKDVVEYLLSAGADLEATTLNGATPLMRAIESSSSDVVQLLIDNGAKLRVENRKGYMYYEHRCS